MRRNGRRKFLAGLLAYALIFTSLQSNIAFAEEATSDTSSENTTTTYTLEASSLTAFAAGTKADGDTEVAGTDNYFTIIYSAKTKVDSSSKTFDDGYASSQRINFGGVATTEKNSIKITTTNDNVEVKVWWAEGGDDNRQMALLDSTGTAVSTTSETLAKNATCVSTLTAGEAGTYYLGNSVNNNYIFKVVVEDTAAEKPARADFSTVAAPVIESATVNTDGTITVVVTADVSYDGADKVTVTMTDADGNVIDTKSSSKEATSHTLTFTPKASGDYTFSAVATRAATTEDEEDSSIAAEATVTATGFVLPLTAPAVNAATNKGTDDNGLGQVEVEWDATTEASYYIVTVDGEETVETTETTAMITGLTLGNTYTIGVKAARSAEDKTDIGVTASVTVNGEKERTWAFAAYGSSTNTKNNGYVANDDGSVTVYSESGKGKIVPNSTDGVAFYYTTIDVDSENFTLEADITVDSWTLSNGQEGFGIMAADTIGANGDGNSVWNNSIQDIVSKVEYYYDTDLDEVTTDTTKSKISMKLGVGATVKLGVTADDIATFKSTGSFNYSDGSTASIPENFTTETTTLETSCTSLGAGNYNIIGNYTTEPSGTQTDMLLTTFHMSIKGDNTGYLVTYADTEGNVIGQKRIYDYDKEELTRIDSDNIYVGIFASRNARVTASNISLTTIAPEDDAAAEDRPITYIAPVYTVESATTANSADYSLVFYGNADGLLTITDADGNVITENADITANTKASFDTTLATGDNTYTLTFTPDEDYAPAAYTKLSSYETATITHTVTYNHIEGLNIYVSPDGTSDAKGTKDDPMDIYTAVKYVAAGQKILLAGGTYSLTSTVTVNRGIDGTASKMIYMIADPEATERPVFNFNSACAGMVLAGDYWYFQGFDVTKSADAQKGITVAGSNNTLDDIRAYRNGNTGIQISRFKSSDTNEYWPENNLILNCTSYLNADKGYEDADGFAAKLTIGEGNVFDGCISAYNADDGWDLFAKAETGAIGAVTIKNSVAFMNGYVLDADGNLVDAGNGNGFKMGGESISGKHMLINSIAFDNKAKGIDSNSCPDIQVYNSISFDNESYNVAFYTNTAVNTAFVASNLISYKVSNDVAEQIKTKGTQDTTQIYGTTNYYCYGKENSYNSENTTVTSDWFTSLDAASVIAEAVSEISADTFGLAGGEATVGIVRNADGTVNTNGFLELTSEAGASAGINADEENTNSSSTVACIHEAGQAVKENVVPATIGQEGSYDMVVYCVKCHEEISRETYTIPALKDQIREQVRDHAKQAMHHFVERFAPVVRNAFEHIFDKVFHFSFGFGFGRR